MPLILITIMTQATDTDIRELKTAIDGNTRAIATQSDRIEVIGRSTEANTKAVEAIDRRIESLTNISEANAKAIEANTKAIADLTSSVTGLREEMRLGFSGVQGQITNLDTKLSGQITNAETKLDGKIETLTGKFDERTKGLGQRLDGKELAIRNVSTGLTVTIVGGILLSLGRFLFFGIGIKP
jgi:chromosome segregation ATPase